MEKNHILISLELMVFAFLVSEQVSKSEMLKTFPDITCIDKLVYRHYPQKMSDIVPLAENVA